MGVGLGALVACTRREPDGAPRPRLTVLAAASLREPFTELVEELGRLLPNADLALRFGGSQELRAQLEQGAPADVLATADTETMDALLSGGLVEAPRVFAQNRLVVITHRGHADRLRSFADLARAERIVLGAEASPIGRYTARMLAQADAAVGPGFRAAVERATVSRELHVRHVLAKVALGEADAGVVYRTDARTTGEVVTIELPPALETVADYPIATVRGASSPALAARFIALVLGEPGRRALERAGFTLGAPP